MPRCDEQLTPTTSATESVPHVLGLASDGVDSAHVKFEHSISTRNGAYDAFKSYTHVTKSAAPRTSIHMEPPRRPAVPHDRLQVEPATDRHPDDRRRDAIGDIE